MSYYLFFFLFLKTISINYLLFYNQYIDDYVNKIFVSNIVPNYTNQNYSHYDKINKIQTDCLIPDYKNKYLKDFVPYEYNTY